MSFIDTYAMVVGRVLIGLLFVVTGIQAAQNFAGVSGMIMNEGIPMASLAAIIVIVVKIGGGAALVLGWNTKYASLALMAFVALTIIFVHNNFDDQLVAMLKNLAIIGGLLYVYKHGPGSHHVRM